MKTKKGLVSVRLLPLTMMGFLVSEKKRLKYLKSEKEKESISMKKKMKRK